MVPVTGVWMGCSASFRSRVASYISICVRSRSAARKLALSVRSSRMRDRRARASGWSTTVSCTRDTVSACASTADSAAVGPTPRSAGAGELGVVGGRGSDHQDLGAVGAVGVPPAGGISVDAEAVVDLGVVAFAEQPGVLQAGLPAQDPLQHMMNLAPPGRGITAGEDARPVPGLYRSAQCWSDQPLGAAQI